MVQIISTTDKNLPWHTALLTFFQACLYFYEPPISDFVTSRSSNKERLRAQLNIPQVDIQNHWRYTRIFWLLLQKGTCLPKWLCNIHLPMWTSQRL